MRALKIPEELQDEITHYLTHVNETPEAQQDLPSFFKLISFTFQKKILFHMYQETLNKVPALKDCNKIEKSFIVMNLESILFMPQDVIIRQFEEGEALYFLNRGTAEVYI